MNPQSAPGQRIDDVAVLTYISPKFASAFQGWCFEDLNGTPALFHLARRLQLGLGPEFEYVVACHDRSVAERVEVMAPGVQLFAGDRVGRRRLLADFCRSQPQVKTVLVFPENSLFPDCRLTETMLRVHRNANADATWSTSLPVGFVPEVFESSALLRLDSLPLPTDVTAECVEIMRRATDLSSDEPDLAFKLVCFDGEPIVDIPSLAELPSVALLHGHHSKLAAETVLQTPGLETCYGATPACALKRELVRLQTNLVVPQLHPAALPTEAVSVLFCSAATAFSGAEESFASLIAGLDRRRFQPSVVLRNRGALSRKLETAGIRVDFRVDDPAQLTATNVRYFQACLSERRVRIVHIDAMPMPALVMAAYSSGIPIVYHIRTFYWTPFAELLKFATRIIAISDAVAGDLKRHEMDPERIVRIHNGIDLSVFTGPAGRERKTQMRTRLGIPADAKVIVLVARIAAQKRQHILLRALADIVRKHPTALVLLVGEAYATEAGYEASLRDAVLELKLERHVRFWGFEEEIRRIYVVADVLALCTENEPFGRCIIEALAMGVPVVAPRKGGHTEFLTDGRNAMQFDAARPDELASVICDLLSNGGLCAALASEGIETAGSLDIRSHVRQVEQVYSEIATSEEL